MDDAKEMVQLVLTSFGCFVVLLYARVHQSKT
jgi:hypothetical protein